jgi:RNA polymerase sigma-70 factor, ECF subfamily
MSELGIARRIAGGDREQFATLIRQYNRRLYRLARATLRDDAEAEDALQDAYLSAYHGIRDFRGDAAISTWLSRLVLNECLGRIRRGNRRSKVVPLVSSNDEVGLVAEEPARRPERIVARA